MKNATMKGLIAFDFGSFVKSKDLTPYPYILPAQIIDFLAEEINILEETLEKEQEPRIMVWHVMYPNVHVTIKNLSFETKSELESTILYEEEGQIRIVGYFV